MSFSSGNYIHLIHKIDDFIRRFYINKILRGSIYLSASLFTGFVVVTFAEYFGNFSPPVRTGLFYSYLVLNFYILIRWIIIPVMAYYHLGKTITHEQAASIIGEHFSPVKDKLLNTLQLKKLSEANLQDRSLIDASIDQKIAELSPVPFKTAVKLTENKKYVKYALAPLIIILLISFTAPAIFNESTERLIKHNQRFVKKAPFNFQILNDKLTAVQGDDYELRVKLVGNEIPDELYLEDGVNTFKLEKESIIQFKHTFNNIQETRKIRLTGGGYESETYTIDVKRKPALLNFDIKLEYPAYLNKKSETVNNAGDITVPAGTKVTWEFNARNTNRIEFNIREKQFSLNPVKENRFRFTRTALDNFTYQVRPVNGEIVNAETASYQLTVIPDLHPAIQVNEKQDSVNSKVLYFIGQVNDDHGLSRLTFNYRILDGRNKSLIKTLSRSVAFDKNAPQSNFFHVWNVSEINAQPGQQIEYFFEVRDNDAVNGTKASRSPSRIYKIPTMAEVEKKLENGSEVIKEKMKSAIRKASEIDKEAKRLNQDLVDKRNLSYEDKKQIEQLLQKQAEFDQLIKDIQTENRQNLFERKEHTDQREEILQKQKQIEDLFNNVLNEKTRELLKNIEKLLDQNNKNLTQSELSKMQIDNKTMQKELDRLLELYKQLEFDQKLTENIDQLNELSKDQQKLSNESVQKNADENALKNKQEQLTNKFEGIRDNLKQLEEKNEQLSDKNNLEKSDTEQESIKEQQEESSKNLDNKKMKQAAGNQQKAAQQMKQLSEKLEKMKEENEEQENQVNSQALREILDNLLTSSFDQEKIMQSLRNTSGTDPGYIVQTQKQKDIQDNLKMIQDSLYALSKKVPQIESVVNKEVQLINTNISKALEHLSERKTSEANRDQQYAMTSINNLALMLSEALEQLQKAQQNARSGGKGKKQPSLSQLSQMQEELNKNMQKARQQMQQGQGQSGQKPSKGPMSEQMAKMAMQQQMIRQALQDINRELNKDGKGGLGNLGELMKEMEQTETDLVNKKIQHETLIRQQEILSQLLDAEKAEREREFDNERESKSGKVITPNYNIILQEYQKLKQRELELLKTIPPSLNSFYKNKVGDYFKFLNSENKYVK